MKFFKKSVAPAGYKNKQCRKQTSVLSGRTVTAYVPLRSATWAHRTIKYERAAFLIPCRGLRGLDTIFFTNSQFSSPRQACAVLLPPQCEIVYGYEKLVLLLIPKLWKTEGITKELYILKCSSWASCILGLYRKNELWDTKFATNNA